MKNERIKKYFVIFTDVILQILFLIPWVCLGGQRYNGVMYLKRIFSSGDAFLTMKKDWSSIIPFESYRQEDVNMVLLSFISLLLVAAVVQILSAVDLLLVVLRRETRVLDSVCLIGSVIMIVFKQLGPAFANTFSNLFVFIVCLLMFMKFLGVRIIEAWKKANKEHAEIKERESAYKEERKKRLAFPGKYTKLFYQIIWKNFKANWKDYMILVFSGILAIGFLFSGLGMADLLSALQNEESLVSVLRGNGIGSILVSFLVVHLAISVFFLISVFVSYLRKRMKNYGIMINLGIRKKTLYLYMGLELAGCIMGALAGGYLFGNIVLSAVRIVISGKVDSGQTLGKITPGTYGWTLMMTLVIFLLVLVIIHDLYLNTGISKLKTRAVEKETMHGRYKMLFFGIGLLITVFAAMQFMKRERAEGIGTLALLFAGVCLVMKNGWALWLEARENNIKKYYGSLFKNNFLYHRYRTTFRYVYFIGMLHIAILFLFSKELISNMIAQKPESLFPYDYMCMATEEDDAFFEEMEEKYHAECLSYPMVRVSNVDNTEAPEDYRIPVKPQGQHIGISETTYEQLCKKAGCEAEKLNLADDGSEIYVIYQQDKSVKAHPIDYFLTRREPYLHIGQPLYQYNYLKREEYFPKRKVAGERIMSLVGSYRRGDYENIIVFSDAYFDKVKNNWKTTNYMFGHELGKYGEEKAVEGDTIHHWPTKLVLLNVAEEKREAVEEKLFEFKEKHSFDEQFDEAVQAYYSSEKQAERIRGERLMNIEVNILIICALFVISLSTVFLKFASETEEKKRRSELLICMGMRRKERIQILKREVGIFFRAPLLLVGVSVPLLTINIWRLRQYTMEDCMSYLKILFVLAAIYLLIQGMWIKFVEFYLIRKVEGKYEKCNKSGRSS